MNITELKNTILSGGIDDTLINGLSVNPDAVPSQRERYAKAADEFCALYGDGDVSLYSVGGRSEISGNHTDHNYGRVIAASVNLDILAVVKKTDDGIVRIKSEGFPEDIVKPEAIDAPDEAKFFSSAAIIAGMQKAFLNAGYAVGGFDAYTTSNVLKGSGISSSAAFEVMVGNIL
ncbi:MAG: galactokinase, partial [Clostridia bacterium]|nr:galactokinase [Clostridia bacterium]